MGLTSGTIVFQRGRFRQKHPVRSVPGLRVGRRAGIQHVIAVREGKSREVNGGITTVGFPLSTSIWLDDGVTIPSYDSVFAQYEFVAWHRMKREWMEPMDTRMRE
jgi:hypothetical protein